MEIGIVVTCVSKCIESFCIFKKIAVYNYTLKKGYIIDNNYILNTNLVQLLG